MSTRSEDATGIPAGGSPPEEPSESAESVTFRNSVWLGVRWPSVRTLIFRTPPKRLAMVVGACLLAVTGLFGGLDQAESTDTVATVPIGTAVDAGPWKVSVDAARVTDALSGVSLEQPDDRWVIVIATIEVFGTSTSNNEVENALELHAVPGIEEGLPGSGTVRAPRLLLARDGLQVDRLEPGLPERVGFFWEQPRAQPIPKTVDVTVLGFTYGKNAFTHIFGWLDPAPVDRVTQVPVEDRTKR